MAYSIAHFGIIHGTRYCWAATKAAEQERQNDAVLEDAGEHQAFVPRSFVTETPVAMFCGEIILPMTPPDELVAANSTGSRLSWRAATTWRLPNSALPDVSLPESMTATQPRKGESRTKRCPVEATPLPSV